MKTKLLALVLLAGGSMFAQSRFSSSHSDFDNYFNKDYNGQHFTPGFDSRSHDGYQQQSSTRRFQSGSREFQRAQAQGGNRNRANEQDLRQNSGYQNEFSSRH